MSGKADNAQEGSGSGRHAGCFMVTWEEMGRKPGCTGCMNRGACLSRAGLHFRLERKGEE